DWDVVDIHLVLLDEVKQQIQQPLEVRELDRKRVGRGLEIGVRLGHLYVIFIASRTRSIVCTAVTRARLLPSNRISFSRSGFARTADRRSRIGSRYAFNAFASFVFTSTSPTLPARYRAFRSSTSPLFGLKASWYVNTGFPSTVPGMSARILFGSVYI